MQLKLNVSARASNMTFVINKFILYIKEIVFYSRASLPFASLTKSIDADHLVRSFLNANLNQFLKVTLIKIFKMMNKFTSPSLNPVFAPIVTNSPEKKQIALITQKLISKK